MKDLNIAFIELVKNLKSQKLLLDWDGQLSLSLVAYLLIQSSGKPVMQESSPFSGQQKKGAGE